jgi:hypothetical protein
MKSAAAAAADVGLVNAAFHTSSTPVAPKHKETLCSADILQIRVAK